MTFSKLFSPIPDPIKVVFITYLFVLLAMIGGYFSNKVPKDEGYLNIIIASIFVLVSWKVISDIVGSAIDNVAKTKAEKEIDDYVNNYSQEGIIGKQDKELLSLIIFDKREEQESYHQLPNYAELVGVKENLLAREAITKGLANEDQLIRNIATKACIQALKKEKISKEAKLNDPDLANLTQDIYIYLKAWLMLSIKNDRKMDISNINQRYLRKGSPDIKAYTIALSLIKDDLIYDTKVDECLEETYRNKAREIIIDYLSWLIKKLG